MSSDLGQPVQLTVGEELRSEPDLAPTLLLQMEVPSVQEELQKDGLATTMLVQVSIFTAVKYLFLS